MKSHPSGLLGEYLPCFWIASLSLLSQDTQTPSQTQWSTVRIKTESEHSKDSFGEKNYTKKIVKLASWSPCVKGERGIQTRSRWVLSLGSSSIVLKNEEALHVNSQVVFKVKCIHEVTVILLLLQNYSRCKSSSHVSRSQIVLLVNIKPSLSRLCSCKNL